MCYYFEGKEPKTKRDDKCLVYKNDGIAMVDILLALEDKVLFDM